MKKFTKGLFAASILSMVIAGNTFAAGWSERVNLNYGSVEVSGQQMTITDGLKVTGSNTGSNTLISRGYKVRFPLWDVAYGTMYIDGGQTRVSYTDVDHASYKPHAEVTVKSHKDGLYYFTSGYTEITNY